MARQPQARAGDYTGRLKAEGEAKAAAERDATAQQLAMATAAAAPRLQDTIELETNEAQTPESVPVIHEVGGEGVEVEGLESVAVAVEVEKKTFRVNETLDQVTIGYGNTYNFVEGQEYRAPKHIYDYLEAKGFIWH